MEEVLAGRLPACVSFVEVAPENYVKRGGWAERGFHQVAERYPVLTHGLSLEVGSVTAPEASHVAAIRRFVHDVRSPFHSDHLCWGGGPTRRLHELLPLAPTQATMRHVVDRVKALQDVLGLPFALENVTWYSLPGGATDDLELLLEILDRADAKLWLDVNNVHVNALNHGIDAWAWLRQLPLDRVVGMHVAGGEHREDLGLVVDTHGSTARPEVLEMMAWVLERTGPLPVVLERDHSFPSFDELSAELERIDDVYRGAVARSVERRQRSPSRDTATPSVATPEVAAPRTSRPALPEGPGPHELESRLEFALLDDTVAGARSAALDFDAHVYATLILDRFVGLIRAVLPRASARMGSALRPAVRRFVADVGPRSPILRDVPGEFVDAWLSGLLLGDETAGFDPPLASARAHLDDLLRWERVVFDASSLPTLPGPLDTTFALDRPVALARPFFVVSLRTRVDLDAEHPPDEPAELVVVRDRHDRVRSIVLDEVGVALVETWRPERPLSELVLAIAHHLGRAVDDELLLALARFLSRAASIDLFLGTAPASVDDLAAAPATHDSRIEPGS